MIMISMHGLGDAYDRIFKSKKPKKSSQRKYEATLAALPKELRDRYKLGKFRPGKQRAA